MQITHARGQVWGKFANYSVNLPEHSYINVEDFRTPSHFAEYVNKVRDDVHVTTYACDDACVQVDQDNELYESYHAWRKEYELGADKGALWKTCKYALLNNGKEKAPINIAAIRDVDTRCAERN